MEACLYRNKQFIYSGNYFRYELLWVQEYVTASTQGLTLEHNAHALLMHFRFLQDYYAQPYNVSFD
jgi:hypothetical protein